jgi:zinc D-Ala-D-Ala carboxypeptidase
MSLSDHFTLAELTKSQTAARLGIDNTPDDVAIGNLAAMCDDILEPIRAHFGVPFSPSSAYRSEALNKAIGGSPTSAHCHGLAVDIELPRSAGVSNPDLARWVKDNLVYDQIILEFWTGEPGSGWVHIGDALEPRGQVLTYTRGKGYMNGLPG